MRVQPKVKKIYLLLRAADAKSASQRLQNEVHNIIKLEGIKGKRSKNERKETKLANCKKIKVLHGLMLTNYGIIV